MNLLLFIVFTAPALVALALTAFNLTVWPRGRDEGDDASNVSVLIPARDEVDTIETAVESALAADPAEVVVYDDQSTDGTADVLATLASRDERVKVLEGVPLPAGWVGKPHACHRLREAARGDVLCFVDADVVLDPGGLARLLSLMRRYDADCVTAVPRQITISRMEQLVVPLLHVTYTSWLPLPLVWRSHDERFLAANGQLLAVTAAAYDEVGGFEAVCDAVVDDMELCRLLKRARRRVVFADGHDVASCRMYRTPRDVWEGFSKNIFEGLGSPALLVAVAFLYFATFVLPWLALPFALTEPALLAPAALGVLANILQRLLLVWRHDHPVFGVLLHPVGVLTLLAIAMNSWRWVRRGTIHWRGRTYAPRSSRRG